MPRTLTRLLITLTFAMVVMAGAQRPFNVPNYYVSQLTKLQAGVSVTGQLDESDGQNYKDGSYLDIYTFETGMSEEFTVTVSSYDFDTYVSVFDPEGGLYDWNDDDGYGEAYTSRLQVYPYTAGKYYIVVSGYSQYDLGEYEIVVTQGAAAGLEDATPISAPGQYGGFLATSDPTVPYGWTGPSHAFLLQLSEPTALRIAASSNDFDTYLYVYDSSGYEIASNDDADYSEELGYNTDSALFTLLKPGTYVVYVAAWSIDGEGAYTLDLEVYVPQR